MIGVKEGMIDKDLDLQKRQDAKRAEIREEQNILDAKQRQGLIADAQDPKARSARHVKLLEEFDALVEEQKKYINANEFDTLYTKEGASGMNAGTTADFTVYFVNIPSNKIELWCWMESDRLANPVFREFYTERDVVWEERRMRTDSTPTGKLDEQFDTMFWGASPYSWPVIGWPSDLNGITREEANAYFDANYSPSNLTAAIVGDFDSAEAETFVRRYFGRLKRSPNPPAPVRTFSPPQTGVRRFEGEAETKPTVRVRWPGVEHNHVDEPALSVLGDLLNGETGRLQMNLVKGSKIASSAQASQQGNKYGGYFEISAAAAPDMTVEQVERAIQGEVEKLKSDPVPDRELQKVKNQATASKFRRLDGNFLIMIQLLVYDAYHDWRDMTTETDKYLAVTAADVQRVAKKYLDDDLRNVAVYRSKAGTAQGPPDPLYDALPADQKAMADQMKAQIGSVQDPAQIEGFLAKVSEQAGAAPPDQQGFVKWLQNFLQTRLASLKGGK